MRKNVLLGITGGIAAYKSVELLRLLLQLGHEVRCVITESAKEFVTPMTLQVLSGNTVYSELFDLAQEQKMSHIALARWADLVLVAPATANGIAKLAHGLADDLLSTLCLATTAPIVLAPAMNTKMWENLATQSNLACLKKRNIQIIEPEFGIQACGEIGVGRMASSEKIINQLHPKSNLIKKKILVTAGPTREAIDPVRYLSNRSSGKMGYALASAFQCLGADVTLISGPVALDTPQGVHRIDVMTAQEMYETVMEMISENDIFISVAAVADYRVKEIASHKIKKSSENKTLELIKNPDILSAVGHLPNKPFIIGFAAETENVQINAKQKQKEKNCDLMVANLVGKEKVFDRDYSEVLILDQNDQRIKIKGNKTDIASKIATYVAQQWKDQHEKRVIET